MRLLIIAIILLLMSANAASAADYTAYPKTKEQIDGLVKVEKRGVFHHTYTYKLKTGSELVSDNKIKRVKDLRPYEIAHPKKQWVIDFCKRWEPVIGSGAMAVSMYPLISGKLYKK